MSIEAFLPLLLDLLFRVVYNKYTLPIPNNINLSEKFERMKNDEKKTNVTFITPNNRLKFFQKGKGETLSMFFVAEFSHS